jgi:uncharacterized protein (TIGR02246 family)
MHNWGIPNRGDAAADAAIREVLVGYCRCVDTFDDATLLELFTQDGEWLRPGQEPLKGRNQIGAFLAARDRATTTRHIPSNMIVEVQGPDTAVTISCYTLLKRNPGNTPEQALKPAVLGEYHDVFRLEQGRWRIARRDTRHVFRAG